MKHSPGSVVCLILYIKEKELVRVSMVQLLGFVAQLCLTHLCFAWGCANVSYGTCSYTQKTWIIRYYRKVWMNHFHVYHIIVFIFHQVPRLRAWITRYLWVWVHSLCLISAFACAFVVWMRQPPLSNNSARCCESSGVVIYNVFLLTETFLHL